MHPWSPTARVKPKTRSLPIWWWPPGPARSRPARPAVPTASPSTTSCCGLNERHYGALQGLNKAETAAKYGEDQVKIWRRSYDIPPPPLTPHDERYPGRDPRYTRLSQHELPLTECLKDTVARVLPLW